MEDIKMKVNQIYSLLNDINHQMFGDEAVKVNDLSGIISLGKTVIGNTDNTDLFINKLVDRIGRTVMMLVMIRVFLFAFNIRIASFQR